MVNKVTPAKITAPLPKAKKCFHTGINNIMIYIIRPQ
jgi:hypothetical protein